MSEGWPSRTERDQLSESDRIDLICDAFERALLAGGQPRIEEHLGETAGPFRAGLVKELLAIEIEHRYRLGNLPGLDEYRNRFPGHAALVEGVLSDVARRQAVPTADSDAKQFATTISVLAPGPPNRPSAESASSTPSPPHPPAPPAHPEAALPDSLSAQQPAAPPPPFGPYRTQRVLGRGGFGTVYLARDEELDRQVAIKVPHGHILATRADAEAFLAEARTAAGLDHPHIVPVYHVGRSDDGRCYVVSKLIDGTNLKERLQRGRLLLSEVVEIIATVAEALNYAHRQGLVHRDVKPANILLDGSDRPYIADFGLAVHEHEQWRRAGEVSGTPAYMAPEQVRGETHHLDGRTDIWALGVMLYELLTTRRPFAGRTPDELFDEILHREPRPPRMIDESIPEALERVCLKCLAKRISKRYAVSADVARDLRSALQPVPVIAPSASVQISRQTIENDMSGRVKVGSIVQGRYRLDEKSGETTLSTYYLATDLRFDNRVTIWIGRSALGQRSEQKQAFLSLLRPIGGFRHPGFLDHLGHDLLEDGRPLVVMEFIEGTTLDRLGRRLTLHEVRDFATQTGQALQAAHANGICHLSFEPSHILVTNRNGAPRFVIRHLGLRPVESLGLLPDELLQRLYESISRSWSEPASFTSLDLFNVGGAALYLAPEQLQGQAHNSAVDVYQYGTVLYELLSGHAPFAASPFVAHTALSLMQAIIGQPPPLLGETSSSLSVPDDVQAVVLACLAKDPLVRPPTMFDAMTRILAGLDTALFGQRSDTSPAGPEAATAVEGDGGTAPPAEAGVTTHEAAQLVAMGPSPSEHWSCLLRENQDLRLGRAPAGPDTLKVPWDYLITREHAHLRWQSSRLHVRILPSAKNPIYYRGKAATEFEVPLGDEFRIGHTLFRVCRLPEQAAAAAGDALEGERSSDSIPSSQRT